MASVPRHLVLHALWLSLGSASALGLGRFAYALLLPAMREVLGWSYAEAGGLNSANAIGYLAGALGAHALMLRCPPRLMFIAAGIGTALTLIICGATDHYWLLFGLRLAGGIFSALLFIAGGVLAAQLASVDSTRSGLLLGIYYGGVGIGLVLSGVSIPWLLASPLQDQWRWAWVMLGILSMVPVLAALLIRLPVTAEYSAPGSARMAGLSRLFWSLLSYLLFGAGYIGFMTFIIVALREDGNSTWQLVSGFWGLLGLATILSSWVWARLIHRNYTGRGLALLLLVVCAGSAVPVFSTHASVMLLSAVIFGGAFLSVVTATTALVRKALPQERWTQGIAAFTIAFAIGQMIGPIATGQILDLSGSTATGLGASAMVLAVAALVACLQPSVATSSD